MRVAGVGDVATYGEELVHHVVRHLLHIVGGFGFVRGSRLARGLRVLASDDDALHGATHRIFDADGDGAVSARDLAVVLSLARPFFSLTHVALEAKFEAALRDARQRGADPGNPRGVTRERLAQTLRASPLLDAWTRALVVRAAEWLARRASAQPEDDHENGRATDPQPPPAPPRLRPAPGLRSRREELLGADDAAPRPMTTGRGPDALPAPSRDEWRPRSSCPRDAGIRPRVGQDRGGAVSRDGRDQNPRRTPPRRRRKRRRRRRRRERGRIRTFTTRRDRTQGRIQGHPQALGRSRQPPRGGRRVLTVAFALSAFRGVEARRRRRRRRFEFRRRARIRSALVSRRGNLRRWRGRFGRFRSKRCVPVRVRRRGRDAF